MSYVFHQIWFGGGNPFKRLCRAGNRNGTFIAVQTSVMADLQKQRAVAEIVATLDAFAACCAQGFIDAVFEIRILDKGSLNRAGGTNLIFSGRGKFFDFRLKITRTEIAIAADRISLYALDGRLLKNTGMLTFAARCALIRIKLPDSADSTFFERQHRGKPGCAGGPQAGL